MNGPRGWNVRIGQLYIAGAFGQDDPPNGALLITLQPPLHGLYATRAEAEKQRPRVRRLFRTSAKNVVVIRAPKPPKSEPAPPGKSET